MVTPLSSARSAGADRPADPTSVGWLDELVTVLDLRRRLVVAAAVGLSLLGMLAAAVVPQFVPPRPVVGAAVGLAAALLAVALAVAADQADLTVRGARHVRAAGGQLAAVLAGEPTPSAAADLAARIDARAAAGGRHWVAVAPASRSFGSISAWADALGVALAERGRRVVVIDLAAGPTPGRPGVVEVVADELKLGQAVVFDPERMLARLGAGADDRRALEVVTGLVPRLPSDIELLVLALPALGQPGSLTAAGLLDRVLVVAETDVTARVDLIAALDAVDATDTAAEVILLEGARPRHVPAVASEAPDAPVHEAAGEPPVDEAPPVAAATPVRNDEPAAVVEPRGDHVTEHGRWAAPPAHETVTGAKLDAPLDAPLDARGTRPDAGDHPALDDPLVRDEPDDDVRVTAALQTLAQEVWNRDPDER